MVQVRFRRDDGSEREAQASVGATLMSAAVKNDVPGIEAICGGSMVCGTCHVYVDPAWRSRLPPPSAEEQELIDCGLDPQPNSRLACQIVLTAELDGLVVATPSTQL
jgi:2Fe-2S ferredoxin